MRSRPLLWLSPRSISSARVAPISQARVRAFTQASKPPLLSVATKIISRHVVSNHCCFYMLRCKQCASVPMSFGLIITGSDRRKKKKTLKNLLPFSCTVNAKAALSVRNSMATLRTLRQVPDGSCLCLMMST